MTERDPTRLSDESTGMLREALEVAREELPTDEQLASLAEKLGPLLGGPGGGGGGGGAPATGGGGAAGATKLWLAAALLTAATLTYLATRPPSLPTDGSSGTGPSDPPDAALASGPVLDATQDAARASGPVPDASRAPVPEPGLGRSPDPRPSTPDPRAAGAPPETELVGAAQRALEVEPREALRLAGVHARHYADGMLTQEREVIAIDALVRLGRRAQAERRAERFRERWPRSAHLRRITVLLEGD